jgi:hypothetical protein
MAPGVAEACHLLSADLTQHLPAVHDLLGQIRIRRRDKRDMTHSMGSDLHARRGYLLQLVRCQQRFTRPIAVPVVVFSQPPGGWEDGCGESPALQDRHSVGGKIRIPIIEGQADKTAARTVTPHVEQMPHGYAGQPAPAQPVHLPGEALRANRHPVGVDLVRTNRVIHEDNRDPGQPPAQPSVHA